MTVAPRFKILDIVIRDADDCAPDRGVVTEVREYPGHRFRYSIQFLTSDNNPIPGDSDEIMAAMCEEAELRGTGERAPLEIFALPGGFRVREVVRISEDYPDKDLGGRTGTIAGDANSLGEIGVWVDDIGESICLYPRFLTATGDRLPAPHTGRAASSISVSVHGHVTGQSSFIVIDELYRYL